jgi:muramoyltetrapeptide carboxypeptidase
MNRRKFIQRTSLLTVGSVALSSFNYVDSEAKVRIFPKGLRKGDTIALTAPAGAIFNTNQILKIETRLVGLGFKVLKGKTLYEKDGFLAGNDAFRINELHELFKNKNVKAIVAMRGGWGCARLLDKLDYELISSNPKILMGYSDITSLLIAIQQKTGLVTYHGPVGYSSWKKFSTFNVFKSLLDGKPFTMKNPAAYKKELETLSKGKASGQLIGGNLTVITSMIGTTHEPNWENKILFLEETGEEPYRIDRMLWQLKQAQVFKKINGLVIGAFTKCNPDYPNESYSLAEILDQHFRNTNFPVYKGAVIGHIIPKFTLPIGVNVEMDAENFSIRTLEHSILY